MMHALLHSADDLINSDGAWWILALDSILLIPLIFAVFFYPMAVLIGVVAVLVLTVGVVALVRVVHTHQHPPVISGGSASRNPPYVPPLL